MKADFVLDTAYLDRVVLLHQEEGKPPRIGGTLLATGQHHHNLRAAIGNEALDAIDAPHIGLLVVSGARLH